jgi:2-polyprenyl-3-methyl-5-hydroxy-6-metoxy-1,4-benzoquinol methylase
MNDNVGNSGNCENYGWQSEVQPESCGYIAPKIVAILTALAVHRVADLGSGNGSLCGLLSAKGFDVIGVERDEAGVLMSGNRYPGIKFYQMGMESDPKILLDAEKEFDAVVSTEVIEHLYSPHLLPRFASALLKKNGLLIVSTPYHGYLKNLALSIANKWDHHHTPLWHGGHIKFWSRKTLSQLLKEAGFEVVGFHGVGRLPLLWKSMVIVARKV